MIEGERERGMMRSSHLGEGKGEHQREGEKRFCGRATELKNNRS